MTPAGPASRGGGPTRTHAYVLFLTLNVWLCALAGLMTAITAAALAVPLATVGVGLLAAPLLFLFIYVEDRRSVSPEDPVNHPLRTQLVRRYATPLLALEVVALAGYEGILAAHVFGPPYRPLAALALGQLPLVVLAAYGTLKRRPMLDSLAVGNTWAFAVVFAVVLTAGRPVTVEVATVYLAWLCIVFAGVESRNVADAAGDADADRATLAGRIGPGATRAVEVTLKAAGVTLLWVVATPAVAGAAVVHLLLLRLFRHLTGRVGDGGRSTTRAEGAPPQ